MPGIRIVSSRCFGMIFRIILERMLQCKNFTIQVIVLKKVCNFEELFLSRYVPDGEWYCPKCNHGMLIEKLEEIAKCLDFHCKKQATEDKK